MPKILYKEWVGGKGAMLIIFWSLYCVPFLCYVFIKQYTLVENYVLCMLYQYGGISSLIDGYSNIKLILAPPYSIIIAITWSKAEEKSEV